VEQPERGNLLARRSVNRSSQGHGYLARKPGRVTLDVRQNRLLLPSGDRAPEEINVVVEIPSGSRNKYEYDKALDIFTLDRALHSAIFYPGDYGFVPRTLALDGDPLDVLILVSEATFSGCLVTARPIGLLKMIDGGAEDDKVLAVPVGEPDFAEIHNHTQIFSHQLRKIQHFFETYKALEGKKTSVGPWTDAADARRIITESMQRFVDAGSNGKTTSSPT
jgi:inorganic pyrophosphatase